ncbi:MAG: hypothetical protein ACR2J3_01855, partial [Aridibacter sp.]
MIDFSRLFLVFMKAKSTFLLSAMFVSLVLFQGAKANTGGIFKGKLLNSAGKPCPHTELELVSIDAEQKSKDKRLWTITSTGGFFT